VSLVSADYLQTQADGPLVMIPGVGCRCPRDEVLVGKECVKPFVCKPPQVPNVNNTGCVCPGNEVLRRGKCVEPEKSD
jgi:hypothetical protein